MAMTDPLAPVRAWAPTAKAAVLFLLPLPLTIALLRGLIAGDAARAAFSSAALACLWGSAMVVTWALAAEARYALAQRPRLPAVPLKVPAAALTASGVWCAAIAAGHTGALPFIFAALGAIGHLAFYGRDVRPARIRLLDAGAHGTAVAAALTQAHGRLRGIDVAARAIAAPDLRDRLFRLTTTGRSILEEIERDPTCAARARRFLTVHLEGAERAATEYARTHRRPGAQPLADAFRRLLLELERTFTEQHRRLVERDLMTLGVEMEVLSAQIRSQLPPSREHDSQRMAGSQGAEVRPEARMP